MARSWQIVGELDGRAFLCKNGEMLDLGTLPGDRASRAHGINASGLVIGEISGTGLYNGRTRAFLLAAVKKATSAPTSMILR